MGFAFHELSLKGAYEIDTFSVGDLRGGFSKVFEKDIYLGEGVEFIPNEAFASTSAKNVIRGLHFQINNPQAKLVSVLHGRVWDVIVDLRLDSHTYKRWVGVELSSDNHKAIYIPRGFAHGFASFEDATTMLYLCDGKYDKETDTGIRFDDKEIGIDWPIKNDIAIYSERDKGLMGLSEYEKNPMRIVM